MLPRGIKVAVAVIATAPATSAAISSTKNPALTALVIVAVVVPVEPVPTAPFQAAPMAVPLPVLEALSTSSVSVPLLAEVQDEKLAVLLASMVAPPRNKSPLRASLIVIAVEVRVVEAVVLARLDVAPSRVTERKKAANTPERPAQ